MKKKVLHMNDVELININEIAYALISSPSNPNLLMPSKVRIIDLDTTPTIPKYVIQIEELYDDMKFLSANFMYKTLLYARRSNKSGDEIIDRRCRNKLSRITDINTKDDIYKILSNEVTTLEHTNKVRSELLDVWENNAADYYLSLDSVYVFSSYEIMMTVLKDVTDFYAMDLIRQLAMFICRDTYKGGLFSDMNSKKLVDAVSGLITASVPSGKKSINKIIPSYLT